MASKIYPRPQGGPEPSAQGASDNIPMSDHSTQPEGGIYDYKSSMEGASSADLLRGYSARGKFNAASDPGPEDKAAPKPRT